jgi:hypothetical protein
VQHRGAKPRRRLGLRAVVAIGCVHPVDLVTHAREAARAAGHGACIALPARPQLGDFVELLRAGRAGPRPGPRPGVELALPWRRAGRAGRADSSVRFGVAGALVAVRAVARETFGAGG